MTSLNSYGVFHNGIIIDPAPFRAMNVNMSPFSTNDAVFNRNLWMCGDEVSARVMINEMRGCYTRSAKEALLMALRELHLAGDDEVWIETTTNNRYVSRCVTDVIELVCRWSRTRTDKTAAILVIHEFGFVYPGIKELCKTGLPIIEDGAYAMFSESSEGAVGVNGDYAIFSLSKMLPMQAGGVLVSRHEVLSDADLTMDELKYFGLCYRFWGGNRKENIAQRLRNYHLYEDIFLSMGYAPRMNLQKGDVPAAFLFRATGRDLGGLKTFLQSHGIECSVFYGEETFFLPCHQQLEDGLPEYIGELVAWFFNASGTVV
ncbi:MAG: DegT/DnrJ/EryC1/StrS aminotransferase family protein [Marinilabiliaceae bacterium]|nr:DegT/DnrJ/EryC1/StrS aminotransferase family protein [Marinilabiliaceae bacterium]